jgi:hypothetical protein
VLLLLRSAMTVYILKPWPTKLAVLRSSSTVPQSLVLRVVSSSESADDLSWGKSAECVEAFGRWAHSCWWSPKIPQVACCWIWRGTRLLLIGYHWDPRPNQHTIPMRPWCETTWLFMEPRVYKVLDSSHHDINLLRTKWVPDCILLLRWLSVWSVTTVGAFLKDQI